MLAKPHAGEVELVDVRSPQENSGELMAPPGDEQEGASRMGHIPGAQSIPCVDRVGHAVLECRVGCDRLGP